MAIIFSPINHVIRFASFNKRAFQPPALTRSFFLVILIVNVCIFLPGRAHAATSSKATANETQEIKSEKNRTSLTPPPADHWYWLASAGLVPQPSHDSGTDNEIIADKETLGYAGEYAAILEPAIYHRIGQASLVGLSGTFIFENYARNYLDHNSLSFSTYSANVSALSFTGPQPGLGYFARIDVGPSKLVRAVETAGVESRTSYDGMLWQLGFGYGFQFSEGCRMLVDMRGVYNGVTDHHLSAVSINMGVLL